MEPLSKNSSYRKRAEAPKRSMTMGLKTSESMTTFTAASQLTLWVKTSPEGAGSRPQRPGCQCGQLRGVGVGDIQAIWWQQGTRWPMEESEAESAAAEKEGLLARTCRRARVGAGLWVKLDPRVQMLSLVWLCLPSPPSLCVRLIHSPAMSCTAAEDVVIVGIPAQ